MWHASKGKKEVFQGQGMFHLLGFERIDEVETGSVAVLMRWSSVRM